MQKKSINNKYYYLIIFSLFLGLCAPTLWAEGMFMDGLFYASCAKNLANGLGEFWYPYLSKTLFPSFHEHPPLAIGLQSIFFYFLGESIYVERIYSLITFIICGFFIHLIWKEIVDNKYLYFSWLPLFFWIIIPLNSWSCSNNMLENTMNIFVCSSVYFSLKYHKENQVKHIFLAGLFIFLAFLTKGFTGIFPLSIFLWLFIFIRKDKKFKLLLNISLLFLFTIIPLILLYLFNYTAIESLTNYINIQVIKSIQEIETVENRFFIVKKLLLEILPIISLSTIILVIHWKKNNNIITVYKKWIYFFFSLAISGVLPIMVSMKQSGFYILTTLPYFCIGFGLLIVPNIYKYFNQINYRKIKIGSFMLLTISIILSLSMYKKIGRDLNMISDIKLFMDIIPKNSTVSISSNRKIYNLTGYFARYGNISLDRKDQHVFHIEYIDEFKKEKNKYNKINIETNLLYLFKRK